MGYVNAKAPKEVYHLTPKKNLPSILNEKVIKRFSDKECWFCESLLKLKKYMEYTVLQEGKLYYGVGGIPSHYPKFVPEDYVVLKLTPEGRNDRWVRWMQEVPKDVDQVFRDKANEFSNLKIGYRGNFRFAKYELIDVGDVLFGADSNWRDRVEERKKTYLPKMRVELESLATNAFELPAEVRGTVENVDGIGYLHVKWDNGRTFLLNPDNDRFRVLTDAECFEEECEKKQAKFVENVNQNVLAEIDLRRLHKAYQSRDLTYPTELLGMLHEQYVKAYGSDRIHEDMDFVMVPGVVLGANNKVYLALLEIDASSSGEHWNTQFITPCGVYSHMGDSPDPDAKQYMLGVVPYKYWYTVQYDGDIHTSMDDCPEDLARMVEQAQNFEQKEGEANEDNQSDVEQTSQLLT